jgi:flavin reductase (DIM6/NTAB) family NADH-FMN oxidoreductase RutF
MHQAEPCEAFTQVSPDVLYFGTPVAVVSTLNPDGTTNLAAMSSFWALGDRFLIGLSAVGQTGANLLRTGECVLNLPSPSEWELVERLGRTTGRCDLQQYHLTAGLVYVADKFARSGFRPLPSEIVAPARAAQCPIQIEARALAHHRGHGEAGSALLYFEVQRLRVHALGSILNADRDRIDVDAWSPLFYVFRHYFGKGSRLGRNFRARY